MILKLGHLYVKLIKKNLNLFWVAQLLMTAIAVFKVDDLGRRPLLITGVSGLVSFVQYLQYKNLSFHYGLLL